MTKNNLKDHLAWLLGNLQLSNPPTAGEASARLRTPTPTASSSRTVPAPQIDLTIDDDSLAEISLEDLTTGHRQEQGMARLNTKSTRKPSLVSKQEQLPTPAASTTGGGRLHQAYTASLNKDDRQKAPTTAKRPSMSTAQSSTSRLSRPTARDVTQEIPEEDDDGFHDLTRVDTANPDATDSTVCTFGEPVLLWTEDHALRPEPLLTPRGKKRKSGEITKASPKRTEAVKAEDDEYPDIADFLDDDMMTPAMVKRRTAGFQSAKRSPPKLQLDAPDATILTQRTVTQTVSTTETRLHRPSSSVGQTPSRTGSRNIAKSESPSKVGSVDPSSRSATRSKAHSPEKTDPKRRPQSPVGKDEEWSDDADFTWSPSPRVSRRRGGGDIIMDSDDEFQTPPSHKSPDAALVTGTEGSDSEQEIPNRATEKESNKTGPKLSSERQSLSSVLENQVVPRSSASLVQPDDMDIDDLVEQQKPTSIAAEGATLIMDMFLEKPHILIRLTRLVNEKLAKNSSEFARSLREKWPPERKLQVKKEKEPLVKEKKALSDLKASHEAHKHLIGQKEDLVTQIEMAYDADEDTTETEARVEEMDREIEQSEQGLKQALVTAGITKPDMFHDLPDLPLEEPEPSNPSAKASSAMATPSSSRDITLIPECLSQVVKKTQALATAPRQQPRVVSREGRSEVVKPPVPHFPQQVPSSSRNLGGSSVPKHIHAPQDDLDMEDLLDDDEDLWVQPFRPHARSHVPSSARSTAALKSRSPAKLKPRRQENHSDYGDGDDDLAAMLAMAEEAEDFEQGQSSVESRSNLRSRSILSETSGNAISTARIKATSKKPVKQVPKPKIPQELLKFPWSSDLLRAFKDRFRLEGFRHNQLEAINATLDGKDAFVLMPTGGGKSLCYQLPAVINSGKTRGVTIVVTPLLSLMQDQVDHLTARGIVAKAFSGDTDRREKDDILQSFKLRNPEHHVQLLYVTPEMINKSTAFTNGLMTLWRNKKLARLVIDEAHCVSQWGHDFRPDYKMLGEVRRNYPGVPVMALTATATNNVIVDIKHNLDMEGCTVFSQSFNRPNLYYEIRPKEKQPVERIADIIIERFPGKTGIVYTLSRKQTENIAKKLTERGIRAEHYHAALQTEEKTQVQRDWQSGRVKVVVATIAFGMGIDKPDVRFVIHHYLPKSLEGYYQETGRAGRDGLPSDCILFFGHGDIHSLRKMIDDGDGNRQQKERQKEMLNRVVMFCENSRDCRRSQLLHYFGESFSRDKCEKTCDNCRIGGTFEVADRTKYAVAALEAVMYHTRLTLNQCTDVLRGTKKPDGDEDAQSFHGIARHLKKPEVSSVIVRLAAEGALDEENRVGGGGIAIQYFILGREAASFLSGGRKLEVVVRTGGDKSVAAKATKKKTTKRKSATEANEELARPASTLVSSPVRRSAGKIRKGKAVASFFDDEAIAEGDESDGLEPGAVLHYNGYEQDDFCVPDDEDDYFGPAQKTATRSRRQRTLDELGPPISKATDHDALDDIHEFIVAAFLDDAKKLEEQLRNSKGYRRPLFTEIQLRQMAITWTTTVDQMRRIPGIKTENVDKFGTKFIPLVLQFYDNYREMMGQDDDGAMATIPGTAGPSTSRRPTEPQSDIIDLVTDDDDDQDDDYEDPGVPSKYFGGHDDPIKSQLDSWTDRFTATTQFDDSGPASRGRSTAKRGSQGGSKRNYFRKGGAGSRGGSRSYSGVSKGKGRRSSGGSSKAGASRGASRPGRGGRGGSGSGIGVMPF
ncbi:RecQ helicase MUSN [Diaporthe amygdali]|uniref:RecQ helicase MUSN n=1 Tax=Phomopsis amygdali TaxID=1214568 RepID=UPI0022FDB883|nr:RecQ helicase MUSN [Diaporthe amygdali]KAJ0121295.1 RecQ helicase MUSN [Diaporthe amygdali]